MSKINQIQSELKSIDGGRFQKLCDLYLIQQPRYKALKAIGSVIGKDKVTTGIPDSIITLPDGTYAFAHYTTQESSLFGKLKGDFESSFEEERTGIPKDQIKEIILCHNGSLSTADEEELIRMGREKSVVVTTFGLEMISYDLYTKYPGLARDLLQVEIDTGQIVSPQEFVLQYGKSSFSTPLDTGFHFRKDELGNTLAALESVDLVLITGPSGVGKSRLMLEAGRQFALSHEGWSEWSILNRGADLFQDTKVYFSRPGKYLILVDDANRLTSRFDYILKLLHDQNNERYVKILATVRDYARDKILEKSAHFGGVREIPLDRFTDEQIRELISEEAGIKSYHFQKRISGLAQGNPRLAMMAAAVAVEHNTLESIFDVSTLYDEYFKSIRQDLNELGDKAIIKVAGIVSFFRAVDRSHQEFMDMVSGAFNIPLSTFWQEVERLHELEVLDLYENEVAKFSDQVLSTYLFYLATFKEGTLDFSILLEQFFPQYRSYFVDALSPVINSLGARIHDQLNPHIDSRWNALVDQGKEDELIDLIQVFWFVKQTETLLYIRDQIRRFPLEEVDLEKLDFKNEARVKPMPLLGLLGAFSRTGNYQAAISLVLEAFAREAELAGVVLRMLQDDFGFRPESSLVDFAPTREVIIQLWARTDNGNALAFSKLFLRVAEHYLHTHFRTTEAKKTSVNIIDFGLPAEPSVNSLRQTIWKHSFTLFSIPALQGDVIELLRNYSHSGYLVSDKDIMAQDAQEVIPFIMTELDPSQYKHIALVLDYLAVLDREGIEHDPSVRAKFTNETSRLADMLSLDLHRSAKSHEEELARREGELRSYVQGFTPEDYENLFLQCLRIVNETHQSGKWDFQQGVEEIFTCLRESGGDIYTEVVSRYLRMGNTFKVDGWRIVQGLIEFNGIDAAYEMIMSEDFPEKTRWLLGFFANIPLQEVSQAHLDELYGLYGTAPAEMLTIKFDLLERYAPLDERIVVRVVEIILSRAQGENGSGFAFLLTRLFNPYIIKPQQLMPHFGADDIGLLKRAYFAAQQVKDHSDYDGQSFNAILDLDPGFLREYIRVAIEAAKGEGKTWISWLDDSRHFLFLWRRDDYEAVLHDAIEFLYSIKQQEEMYVDSYLEALFESRRSEKLEEDLLERQVRLLSRFVMERGNDGEFMAYIFSVAIKLPEAKIRDLVALFLAHNASAEDFRKIPILPSSGAHWGSPVPHYQELVEFLESLLPLVEGLDFLDHRLYLEERIRDFHGAIERLKREDFMRDA